MIYQVRPPRQAKAYSDRVRNCGEPLESDLARSRARGSSLTERGKKPCWLCGAWPFGG